MFPEVEPLIQTKSSVVYKILKENSYYAYKYFKQIQTDESIDQEFLKEVDILNQLNHPNILQISQYHRENKLLVTKFHNNGTLLNISSDENIPNQQNIVRSLMQKIVETIQYIHEQNIVHRDIKCENIFLNDEFEPIIADFGFALENVKSMTQTKSICGTVPYIPPEIYRCEFVDLYKADVFSLGVLLFKMNFNCAPFDTTKVRGTQIALFSLIVDEDFEYYFGLMEKYLKVQINPYLKDLLIKIWNCNPEERISIDGILNHHYFKMEGLLSDAALSTQLQNYFDSLQVQ